MAKKIDLHNHGPWTFFNLGKFPKNMELIADIAIERGLDGVAVTSYYGQDIINGKWREFIEDRAERLYNATFFLPRNKRRYEIDREGFSFNCIRKKDNKIVRIYDNLEYLCLDENDLEENNIPWTHLVVMETHRENLKIGLSYEDTLKAVKDSGGYAIHAHPFFQGDRKKKIEKMRDYIDALEWNGLMTFPLFSKSNKKVLELGERLNLPVISNSDAEQIKDIGRTFTTYYTKGTSVKEIFEAVESGKFERNEKSARPLSPFRHAAYATLLLKLNKKYFEKEFPEVQK